MSREEIENEIRMAQRAVADLSARESAFEAHILGILLISLHESAQQSMIDQATPQGEFAIHQPLDPDANAIYRKAYTLVRDYSSETGHVSPAVDGLRAVIKNIVPNDNGSDTSPYPEGDPDKCTAPSTLRLLLPLFNSVG